MKYKLRLNGKEVAPAEFHRGGKVGGNGIPMVSPGTYTEARPWVSESQGYLPHQIPEARKALAKEKSLTAVSIRDDGTVECTSRGNAGRLGFMKFRGNRVDADGGYGETYEPH